MAQIKQQFTSQVQSIMRNMTTHQGSASSLTSHLQLTSQLKIMVLKLPSLISMAGMISMRKTQPAAVGGALLLGWWTVRFSI
jgi:hypothetical protein